MLRQPPLRTLFGLLCSTLLMACATKPSGIPPGVFHYETDDLAVVADAALEQAAIHGNENVLVVFDIDNTLLAMEQGLGSDQWYYWQKDLADSDRCDPAVVSDRFAVQGALFHASAMRPTQEDAAEQVRRLQGADLEVIALTSRGANYRLQTFRELRRANISLWPTALPPQGGFPDEFVPEGGSRSARYEDGVFLTAGQHKGVMLKALMDLSETTQPRVIVMADDKQNNLDDMAETFQDLSHAVHLYRYSREDDWVADFNDVKAAQQWNQLQPALIEIQDVLGPDNYALEAPQPPEGCEPEMDSTDTW